MHSSGGAPAEGIPFASVGPDLRRETLADQVSARLMDAIATEGLKPGDLLPSEGSLAAGYGVSRSVIRESLRALTALTVVRMTNGARATVRPLSSELLNLFFHWAMSLRAANLPEVLELRRGMEGQAAALAATRLRPADRLKLQEDLRRLGRAYELGSGYAEADLRLHLTIAHASHNTLIEHVTEGMQPLMRAMISDGLESLQGDPAAWRRMHHGHEALVEAIAQGRPEAAQSSVWEGIDWAIERYARGHSDGLLNLPQDALRAARSTGQLHLPSGADETLAEQVSRGVMATILDDGLEPGDPIPSEGELGTTYGVSRSVVREALRGLAALGILSISTGKRAEVLPFSPALLSRYLRWAMQLGAMSIIEVLELRAGIEGESAQLAAKRATPQQAAALRATVRGMREALNDPQRFEPLDLQLHLTLGEASGNRLIGHVIRSFREVIQETIREGLEPIRQNINELEAMQRGHEALIDAVTTGDAEDADASIRQSTERVIERLQHG